MSSRAKKIADRKAMRSKSMGVAMDGKVSLGQLYLTDMKGADKVFSIENRNAAYAADRRKVVKKSDDLSRSCHDEPRSAGIGKETLCQKPTIRSGGRRPAPKAAKDDSESSSSLSSDESSFGLESHNRSKRTPVRRSKSLDMTDSDIVISKPGGKSNVRTSTSKLASRKVPGRSKNTELVPSPPPSTRSSPNVKELCKAFSTNTEPNNVKSLRRSGSKDSSTHTARTCSLSSASSNEADY